MMGDSWRTDEEGVGMPDGLAGMLRGLGDGGEGVTGSVDLAVLGMGSRIGRRRRVTRRVVRGGAVAAVVGLVGMGVLILGDGSSGGPDGQLIAGDMDGDGAVDMRDALMLAIEVRDGGGVDVDGDGVIGSGDVERVAGMAVSLVERGDGTQQTLGVAR